MSCNYALVFYTIHIISDYNSMNKVIKWQVHGGVSLVTTIIVMVLESDSECHIMQ